MGRADERLCLVEARQASDL